MRCMSVFFRLGLPRHIFRGLSVVVKSRISVSSGSIFVTLYSSEQSSLPMNSFGSHDNTLRVCFLLNEPRR